MREIVTSCMFEAVFLIYRAPQAYSMLLEKQVATKKGPKKIHAYVFTATPEALEARDIFQDRKRAASEEGNIPIGVVHRLRHELVKKAKSSGGEECSGTEQ